MIKIITTGGTIEGLDYIDESDRNTATISIKSLLDKANISLQYQIENAFSKDSRSITKKDRELLVEKIIESEAEQILITHGTITMVETAMFLGERNLSKTIVLVGSFIPGTEKRTDAPFNLGFAISAIQTLHRGVFIAMNGKVFNWKNVKKNFIKNRFEENMD